MKITPKKEKAALKFRISFVILFIIASFAACFVFYMKEDLPEEAAEAMAVSTVQTVNETAADVTAVNPVAENASPADKEYFEKCLFAGGELVRDMAAEGIISSDNAVYAAVGDGETDSVFGLDAAADVISDRSAEYIYIFPQTELSEQADSCVSKYRSFVSSVMKSNSDAMVYVVSALPVSAEGEADILNVELDRFNSEMLRFCNEAGAYYLDINTALKGSDGKLSSEYSLYGIPDKTAVCEKIGEYILGHIA